MKIFNYFSFSILLNRIEGKPRPRSRSINAIQPDFEFRLSQYDSADRNKIEDLLERIYFPQMNRSTLKSKILVLYE